ncbi:MAG: glycine cleavage system aminomethyltransferase GcvT [Magnetococcales bacterium]|nr:glycine cleavage system aminomethyltransferase GcvT [Magnetococcales bacterium]MBF0156741.1 glycine cleavage system aminomethyltransferase GcvT [Magnetococcales bacterium]
MRVTPLHARHLECGARMVDFSGWEMPLHYGSQLGEHHLVRRECGLFDVSHMGQVDVAGREAVAFLGRIFAGSVTALVPGQARYGVMLNEAGGIVDDLIVYRLGEAEFRLVINAGRRERDLEWIGSQAEAFAVEVRRRDDLAMVALQGPEALFRLRRVIPAALWERVGAAPAFHAVHEGEWLVARTGYTGEEGCEIMLPAAEVVALFDALRQTGVAPIGLGARDTLRLEAGMNLYGLDMDEEVDPFLSGVAWSVGWDPPERDFIGRRALERLRTSPGRRQRQGLVLEVPGVLRNHMAVELSGRGVGEVTSGGYSPTLGCGIALARLDRDILPGSRVEIEVRGRKLPVRVVRPPFVRLGRSALRD